MTANYRDGTISVLLNTRPANRSVPAPSTFSPSPQTKFPADSVKPTFTWTPISDATSYRIIVATNPSDLPTDPTATTGRASVVIDTTVSTSTFIPTTPLQSGGTYYWEVIATAPGRGGTWSAVAHFTLPASLSAPQLIPSAIPLSRSPSAISITTASPTWSSAVKPHARSASCSAIQAAHSHRQPSSPPASIPARSSSLISPVTATWISPPRNQ